MIACPFQSAVHGALHRTLFRESRTHLVGLTRRYQRRSHIEAKFTCSNTLHAKGSGVVTRSESIPAGILVAIAAQTSAAQSAQLAWSAAPSVSRLPTLTKHRSSQLGRSGPEEEGRIGAGSFEVDILALSPSSTWTWVSDRVGSRSRSEQLWPS